MAIRTRFAPSPTGLLHVGNVRTALFNWLFTRHGGGAFVLRIEDTDRERSTLEHEQGILSELGWLGLDWDEGAGGGAVGPYRQSERHELGIYHRELGRLLDHGDAYYCFCTPEQLEVDRQESLKAGRPPQYVGRCRANSPEQARNRQAAGEKPVSRFKVPPGKVVFQDLIRGPIEVDASQIGDPVLFRSDGWPTYNFAVVVDDIQMKITHVIRGEDHISNTPRQILLYRALGAEPPRFAHLPLVLGMDHAPLSKRHGDTSLRQYREHGYLPEAVFNYLALLGWSSPSGHEVFSKEELVREFDLSRVGRSAGVFDPAKLDWIANQHIRKADPARLADLAVPFLQHRGDLPEPISLAQRAWVAGLMELLRDSVSRLCQVPETDAAQILLHFEPSICRTDPEVQADLKDPTCRAVIRTFAELLPHDRPIDLEIYRRIAQETGKATGTKGRSLYHPIRVALTARGSGPELNRLVPLIEGASALQLPRSVPGCARRATSVAEQLGVDA
ncbi:MAG: glutamate--tRNA ligase [Acidobacteria bacterium]|nr:glutamate--tRNA ligase [Acidobacteriota bacterium]